MNLGGPVHYQRDLVPEIKILWYSTSEMTTSGHSRCTMSIAISLMWCLAVKVQKHCASKKMTNCILHQQLDNLLCASLSSTQRWVVNTKPLTEADLWRINDYTMLSSPGHVCLADLELLKESLICYTGWLVGNWTNYKIICCVAIVCLLLYILQGDLLHS